MAVKEVSEDDYDAIKLAQILYYLRTFSGHMHEIAGNWPSILHSLGALKLPKNSPKNYKEFIENVSFLERFLIEQNLSNEFISVALEVFWSEVCRNPNLSPVISVVLQLVKLPELVSAGELILRSTHSVEELEMALKTMCSWLTKWTWTDNLGRLVLCLMNNLNKRDQRHLVQRSVDLYVGKLFKLVLLPKSRHCIQDLVGFMLAQLQNNHATFHNDILPLIVNVIGLLHRENTESSRKCLSIILKNVAQLKERFKQYNDLYEPYMVELSEVLQNNEKAITENKAVQSNYGIVGGDGSMPKPWLDSNGHADSTVPSSTLERSEEADAKVGLNNLGNTCYMNSVLQALFMTKPFRNEVLLFVNTTQIGMTLFQKLQTLFALLQHSMRPSLSPKDILAIARPPGFQPGQQHDSSEFLGHLLDTLHESEKQHIGTNVSNSTVVQSAFGGRATISSNCGLCGKCSERTDNFRELQLSFPTDSMDNQSVQSLLNYYLQPEQLNGDNQYYCETCGLLTDSKRVTRMDTLPPHLILTLKHFQYDPTRQQRTKLMQSVQLDRRITLLVETYELYAVVVHCGPSVDFGHYYTLAKDKDRPEQWYKFNDSSVRRTLPDELDRLKNLETPYILFYRQEQPLAQEGLSDQHSADLPFHLLNATLQKTVSKHNEEFERERKTRVATRSVTRHQQRRNRDDDNEDGDGGGGGGGGGGGLNGRAPGCSGDAAGNFQTNTNMYVF